MVTASRSPGRLPARWDPGLCGEGQRGWWKVMPGGSLPVPPRQAAPALRRAPLKLPGGSLGSVSRRAPAWQTPGTWRVKLG